MRPRHLHLFDPQLTGVGGHYLAHDLQLLRDVRARGIPVSLYGRRTGDLTEAEGVPLHKVFREEIFTEAATDGVVWPMENFEHINRRFEEDLHTLDPSDFSRDDLIYVPNLIQNQVAGLTRWLLRLPEERRPTVALMFRYLNHAMDYLAKRQNKELIALYYRFAVRDLVRQHPRTVICADTTELAKAYQAITGLPVVELPNPMDVSRSLPTPAADAPPRPPTVVYQGHTSPLRGFHFLPEIIQRGRSLHPRPRFLIQVQNRDKIDSLGLRPITDWLDKAKGPDLELLDGSLSESAYLGLMAQADVILLPYSPSFYGVGSSGVFTEAASAGKVVVVCQGTVPARQAKEYGLGVVIAETWTPAALAQAVAQALTQLPALQARARQAAPAYATAHTATALWDKLLGACG